MRLRATVQSSVSRTLIGVTEDGDDRLRAVLPREPRHPGALRTLLEGLALWRDGQADAVLVVDEPWGHSAVDTLLGDELCAPPNLARVHFDIRPHSRPVRLRGPGDFRLMYRLHGGSK